MDLTQSTEILLRTLRTGIPYSKSADVADGYPVLQILNLPVRNVRYGPYGRVTTYPLLLEKNFISTELECEYTRP